MLLKLTFCCVTICIWLALIDAFGVHPPEIDKTTHPACFFNSLCTCSKGVHDLGIVTCKHVPLARIPRHINISKVFVLHLENNHLRFIEPNFLYGTGLYRIEISWNQLTDITPEAFAGLERTLWEIYLHNNYLTSIPSRSIRNLQRLRLLDLSGNHISDIANENWRGVEESLNTLILRNNDIFSLGRDVFGPLQNLETLDLSENAILDLGNDVFRTGPQKIHRLFLRDNAIRNFPYQQLSVLRHLRHLDLSHNQISRLQSVSGEMGAQPLSLSLDSLHLEYNQIQFLPPKAFDSFQIINSTFLDGNPIEIMHTEAFRGPRMREIYLRNCYLSEISPGSFEGQNFYLDLLDVSGNNLTSFPAQFFNEFQLHTLSLKNNFISFLPWQYLKGFQYSINNFDFSGQDNGITVMQELKRLRNLRSLSLSRLPQPNIGQEDFREFGIEMEELKINNGNLKTIKNNAFQYVRGLKSLDLSDNSISTIEKNAFEEIGHTLQYLNLADGFSSSFTQVPYEAFRHLTSVRHIDLSNNKFKSLPEATFHLMKQLEIIHLDDNNIELIPRGTFQADIHTSLRTISLSFNSLSNIHTHTFTDMQRLSMINLEDNKITRIEKRAFIALDQLKRINLRGNKINFISEEAFQNLPELEYLDVAFNELADFDFSCLDQVGTLSSLKLNVSYNFLRYLKNTALNYISDRSHGPLHTNIEELDFSHNNITWVDRDYFKPIESSITHLHFGFNSLTNVTRELFGNMRHLQWLDLSHNRIRDIDFDSFSNIQTLQVLQLSNNLLHDLPNGLFQKMNNLRVLDLSFNRLRTLPDIIFFERGLEEVVLNNNYLTRIPVASFSIDSAASIVNLDFSNNDIVAIHSDAFSRFQSLQKIDLSENHLVTLENNAFAQLPHLAVLNISNNIELSLDSKSQEFRGVEDTLEELYMKNISMRSLPEMHLPSLHTLDLSANNLQFVQQDLPRNISSLRNLYLDENRLEEVPNFLPALTQLRVLSLRKNPIKLLNFQPGSRLKELDIRDLPLQNIAPGTLNRLPSLRTLRFSPLKSTNIAQIIEENYVLEHLHLDLDKFKTLQFFNDEMRGYFGSKLRNITISGGGFSYLPDNFLEGFQSSIIHMTVSNTSIEKIPRSIFLRGNRIRNLTLDVRTNGLKVLGNPSTGAQPNLPRKTFLIDLKLARNPWYCDCELGWVEGWLRKKRQYICEGMINENCRETPDDLRITQCHNKKEQSLMEVLKYDIECGWNSAADLYNSRYMIILISFISLYMNKFGILTSISTFI